MSYKYFSVKCHLAIISASVMILSSPFIFRKQSACIGGFADSEESNNTGLVDKGLQGKIQDTINSPDIVGSETSVESKSDYLVVDDFESYNDIEEDKEGSNRIYKTWKDGFDNPTKNGSTFGYVVGDTLEKTVVYGGMFSVPLCYDNTIASLSEVTVNTDKLPIGRDWTKNSPKYLVMWIHGESHNPNSDRLYLKVNDSKVLYDGDISKSKWMKWNIDLPSLGIDLSNVSTLAIGFERTGSKGGTGAVLIDEIRLYQEAPILREQNGILWMLVSVIFIILLLILIMITINYRKRLSSN